jgi:hypothetical protein
MAKNIKVKAELDGKTETITIGALNFLQSKAVRKKRQQIINYIPEELMELQKREQLEDGLSPDEMQRVLEIGDELEEQSVPIMMDAIRMGLAKHDPSFNIPVGEGFDSDKIKVQLHERIGEMFTQHEINVLFDFVTSGQMNADAIQATLEDVDLTSPQ